MKMLTSAPVPLSLRSPAATQSVECSQNQSPPTKKSIFPQSYTSFPANFQKRGFEFMAPVMYDLVKTAAYEGAIFHLKTWTVRYPNKAHLRCLLGIALLGAHRLDEASVELNIALTLNPGHAAALGAQAELLRVNGCHAEAIDTFLRAMSIGGFNATWGFSLALTHLAIGNMTEAKRWNRRVIRADGTANLPWALDGHIKRSQKGWFVERSFRKALRPFSTLIGQPQFAQAPYDASERERARISACVNGCIEPISEFMHIYVG